MTFAHVSNDALSNYLRGADRLSHRAAFDYSTDCLEADIRADESGMECAPPIAALNAREAAHERARLALESNDLDGVRAALQDMWNA